MNTAPLRINRLAPALLALLLAAGCASRPVDRATAQTEVMNTERAFARTMADRDFVAFQSFLSTDAVFFGDKGVQRGKQEIKDAWWPFYSGPSAPFSWEPAQVEVLESGHLALSTGPVKDPHGRTVATFNSIWREEEPGVWRIVFDKGCSCEH